MCLCSQDISPSMRPKKDPTQLPGNWPLVWPCPNKNRWHGAPSQAKAGGFHKAGTGLCVLAPIREGFLRPGYNVIIWGLQTILLHYSWPADSFACLNCICALCQCQQLGCTCASTTGPALLLGGRPQGGRQEGAAPCTVLTSSLHRGS